MRRRSRGQEPPPAEPPLNLFCAALALPVVRARHQRAGEHSARSAGSRCAASARTARRRSARAIRWSSCSPASAPAIRAWRFGYLGRARRRALHLVHHRARLHRPGNRPAARRHHAAAALARACSSTSGGAFVPPARRRWSAPSPATCRCGSCTGPSSSLTGKEGMGYGDFKMLAAVGAFLGWKMLPLVILLSSFVGLVFGVAADVRRARQLGCGIPLPLRSLLALAGDGRAVLGRARSCAGICRSPADEAW